MIIRVEEELNTSLASKVIPLLSLDQPSYVKPNPKFFLLLELLKAQKLRKISHVS